MSTEGEVMSAHEAVERAQSWALNPLVRPSPEQSRVVAATLVAEVQRLQGVIARAKQESVLIEYNGLPALVVPYWFMKS